MISIEIDDWNDVSSKTILKGAIGPITFVNNTKYKIVVVNNNRCYEEIIYPNTTIISVQYPMFINDIICFYMDNISIHNLLKSIILKDEFKRTVRINSV